MSYEELKKLAIMLYGEKWKLSLRHDLEVKQHTFNNWERQGVPDWVFDAMASIVNKRKKDIDDAITYFNWLGGGDGS